MSQPHRQARLRIVVVRVPTHIVAQVSALRTCTRRYYDPVTGQFLTIDPKLADTRQPYLYVDDDPLNGVDPTGLCWSGFGWACSASHAVAHAADTAWDYTGGKVVHYVHTHTIGWCVNASAGWGAYFGASGCFGLSGGTPFVSGTVVQGGSAPTASVTTGPLISNASNPGQLRGAFAQTGGSGGEGPVAGGDFSYGNDSCGHHIWETQVSAGLGARIPPLFGEGHAGVSYTGVTAW